MSIWRGIVTRKKSTRAGTYHYIKEKKSIHNVNSKALAGWRGRYILFFPKIMSQLYGTFYPPHVRESKTVLNSGFQVLDSRFFVSRYWLGFQSSLELQIPCAVFRIPKPRIPDSKSEDSGFWIPQAEFSWILETGYSYMKRWLNNNWFKEDLVSVYCLTTSNQREAISGTVFFIPQVREFNVYLSLIYMHS